MVTRRNAIASVAAAALLPSLVRRARAAHVTLEAAAAHRERFFGSAVRIGQLKVEDDLREAVLRECLYLVPEIEMDWAQVEATYGELTFDKLDDLASFAGENGKRIRGHTLLWHLSVPDWAVSMLRENRDWMLIARYFGSIIPRYGDVINQWEVVNEPIDIGHRADGLRDNIFLEAFGPDYIARALQQARIFAPHAQLLINEYGLEYANAEERARRYYFLKLLERLRKKNVPLDAVGVQAHLDLSKGPLDTRAIASFFREVAGMGLSFVITELDVKEADFAATDEQRDRLAADEVRRYLDVALAQWGVKGVTTWGLSDRHSWLTIDGKTPGLNRGLPFDASMQPTPMFYAIADALWSTGPGRQMRS